MTLPAAYVSPATRTIRCRIGSRRSDVPGSTCADHGLRTGPRFSRVSSGRCPRLPGEAMSIQLQIMSDLHLELMRGQRYTPTKTAADVVILAGDIHDGTRGIDWARAQFPNEEGDLRRREPRVLRPGVGGDAAGPAPARESASAHPPRRGAEDLQPRVEPEHGNLSSRCSSDGNSALPVIPKSTSMPLRNVARSRYSVRYRHPGRDHRDEGRQHRRLRHDGRRSTLPSLMLPDPFAQLVGTDPELQRQARYRYPRLQTRLDQLAAWSCGVQTSATRPAGA